MIRSIFCLVAAAAILASHPVARAAETEESLVSVLQSQAPTPEKWVAARSLAVIATTNSISKLAALLNEEPLSDLARYVLEPMPDPAADAALRAALTQTKGQALEGIITSIGVRRDSQAVALLNPFLTNADPTLVRCAAAALGKIGGGDAAKCLNDAIGQSPENLRYVFFARMIECADQTLAAGKKAEAHEQFDWIARAKAPLDIHDAAIRGLILSEEAEGLKRLPDELKLETTMVIRMVQTELPDPAVSSLLAESLNQPLMPDRRQQVILALGGRRDEFAVKALLQLAQGTNKVDRLTALRTMGSNPAFVSLLSSLASDPDTEVSGAARESLASIPSPEADAAILKMFDSAATRSAAIALSSRRSLAAALPKLFEIAQSGNAAESSAALAVTGELVTEKEIPTLLALISQTNIDLTVLERALVQVDSRGGHPDFIAESLGGKLQESSPAVQMVLLRVLGENGSSKALGAVRGVLSWKNADVKHAAIRVLAAWRSPEEAPDLLEQSRTLSDPAERQLCIQGGLRLISSEELTAGERFDLCLKARPLLTGPEEKKMFLSALGGTGFPGAAELLPGFLDDPATRSEAAAAILTVSGRVLTQTNHLGVARLKLPLTKVVELSGDAEKVKKAQELLAKVEASPMPPAVHLADYPFFPFCIDWHDSLKRNFTEQAVMLQQLGYVGVGHIWLDGVAERLASLDKAGLKLFQITMVVDVSPGKQAFDPKFKDVLALVNGRHVQFDLIFNGMPASDVSVDAHAVEILNQMSDLAKDTDAQLLLYPHQASWIERIEDAVRVADKVNRPNVGVMFNLCHWLRVDSRRDYKPILEKAMPRLWAISISGADVQDPAPGWDHYIQPLDSGSFEMGPFLKTLRQLGYKGPIGLQCFGIGGDTMEHLERSQGAWRRISVSLND